MLMTVKDIATKLEITPTTVRTWLDGHIFSKYRKDKIKPICYEVNCEFWLDLLSFVENKNLVILKNLEKRIRKIYRGENENKYIY